VAQNNARIIEKDIFADVTVTEAGSSEVIDLFGSSGGANRFSIQAVYDVQAPAAKTFDSGNFAVDTATFTSKAGTSAGDYVVIYDTEGFGWAVAADITGTDPEPTGGVWDSIASSRKSQVDLSSVAIITDIQVALAFKNAFKALTDVPFGAAENVADVTFAQDIKGLTTEPSVHNADDSGAGSISVTVAVVGIPSEVDIVSNTVTVPDHGYTTGFKVQLTTDGTLPAGLSTATDYFLIVVDENTLQFAASLANAQAGTEIDLTTEGSKGAEATITGVALAGASVKFQCSNDGTTWADIQTATAITVDGSTFLNQPSVAYRYFKAVKALTSGQVDLQGLICVIGDAT
jgi:hypothetical protein